MQSQVFFRDNIILESVETFMGLFLGWGKRCIFCLPIEVMPWHFALAQTGANTLRLNLLRQDSKCEPNQQENNKL